MPDPSAILNVGMPAEPAVPQAFTAVLRETRRLGPVSFVLRLAGCRALAGARAGQFVMLRGEWGRDPLLPRAFSLLDVRVGGDAEVTDVLVKTVGRGTALLESAAPGARFALLGPLGNAFDLSSPPDVVCVAGGVGLAPLLLFARQARARFGAAAQLELHYGGRSAPDLVLREECEQAFDRVDLATEDGSRGTPGRVTEVTARRLAARAPATPLILTCGPTRMMEAVARLASDQRTRCFASLEGPMACGYGVCLGCAVPARTKPYRYVCSDGPIFDTGEIREWV